MDAKCKQLSYKVFNCERTTCNYSDTVDEVKNRWTITIEGLQKKFCKVLVILDNPDVTKTNSFLLTKTERNNLAAYFKFLFDKKPISVIREQTCCSESKAVKKFCYTTVGGNRVLDIIDDRPYFGCDGTKLFDVEQSVVSKGVAPISTGPTKSSDAPVAPPPPPPLSPPIPVQSLPAAPEIK